MRALVGAAVAVLLALLVGLSFDGLDGQPALSFYAPIGIAGAISGWTTGRTRGSLEKRLLLATSAGTAVGVVCAALFLRNEEVDTTSALALGLILLLASGISATAVIVLPERAA